MTTKAGRALHDNIHDCGESPSCGVRLTIAAIEAEAREQITYASQERRGFLRGRAALLAELEAEVGGLPDENYETPSPYLVDRAAVLDLIRKAGEK